MCKAPSKEKNNSDFTIEELMKKGNLPNESLEPFDPSTDYIVMMQKFKEIINNKDSDWTMQVGVINYIRRLFKYEKSIFNQTVYGLKLYPNILNFINSIRSIVAKNTLVLINEIFSEYVPEFNEKKTKSPVINLIKAIVPSLINKANCNQSFIKNEANASLDTMVANMKYADTLLSLLQQMNTNKAKDAELVYTLSMRLIVNLGKDYLLETGQFNELMKLIISIYEARKNLYSKKLSNLLSTFITIMSKENFNNRLEKCTKKERQLINEILEAQNKPEKKKSNSLSRISLKSAISKMRKNNKISKPTNIKTVVLTKNKQIEKVVSKNEQTEKVVVNENISQNEQIINN